MILISTAAMFIAAVASAQSSTLRADFIFAGTDSQASISLDKFSVTPGWFGRRVNMDSVPVAGNGQISLKDCGSGKTLYISSFSTLFQEWQATPEAKQRSRAFQNTFLLPMPEADAVIDITLYDSHGRISCSASVPVSPDDILIQQKKPSEVRKKYIHKGGDPEDCIDVVILAEGYTSRERAKFYKDAKAAVEAIFSHEPFGSCRDRFNFLAVAPESEDSGVSVPRESAWKNTPVSSHFDTFYSDRYLTTLEIFKMHDLLSGLPYEHLIILANTDTYGGGGIYNSYTLTTAHHRLFKPVVVHEFGHSFGALADEYDYAGEEDPYYFPDVEPWEKNITTLADFESKWKHMIDEGVPGVGLVEGAGYQQHGVWRACEDCRMKTNTPPAFCPVCQEILKEMIDFYTVQK